MNTIDQIALEHYGKIYKQLPDDGAEQDHVQGIFERQTPAHTSSGFTMSADGFDESRQGFRFIMSKLAVKGDAAGDCRLFEAAPDLLAALHLVLARCPEGAVQNNGWFTVSLNGANLQQLRSIAGRADNSPVPQARGEITLSHDSATVVSKRILQLQEQSAEMLSALEGMMSYHHRNQHRQDGIEYRNMVAAIAKAKGQA